MPIIAVRIPQMGEGLQEARLVDFLKQPGDRVKRDEPIYVMETDKAITEVESPYDGQLVEWTAEKDAVLSIGTEIGRMEVAEGVKDVAVGHGPVGGAIGSAIAPPAAPVTSAVSPTSAARKPGGGVPIPPRTKKYLREKGLLDVAKQIPAAGKKLMPADVDRYLAGDRESVAAGAAKAAEPVSTEDYDEDLVPQAQQTLNYRMQRGAQACVAATIAVEVDWTAMDQARDQTRDTTGETAFSMALWCVVQAMNNHPGLRSSISGDGRILRTYKHVNLGVAVAIPGDLLRTAVVRSADTLDRAGFRESLLAQIEKVRDGADQIDATTTVTISNIGSARVQLGIPVIVTPAVATIALGTVEPRAVMGAGGVEFRNKATLTMTFDHRVINGVGAASFLNEAKELMESYQLEASSAAV